MKRLITKAIGLLLFTLPLANVQAHQCHSILRVINNTAETFLIQNNRNYNNVERFQPLLVLPHSNFATDWYSNNGVFDSTSYWLHLSFTDKDHQEVLKMSADATDKNEYYVGRHICRPENFWIVSGELCKRLHCSFGVISDQKELANFTLTLNS